MDGYGVFTWSNGNIFEGYIHNAKRCGFGKLIHADGKVEEGNWNEGEFYD